MTEETKEALEQLRQARKEEQHEVNWIGQRMGWMLTAEAFLIAAAVQAQTSDKGWGYGPIVTFVLGCFGVWLAIRAGLAIRAAEIVIEAWLRRERRVCKYSDLRMYRLHRPLHDEDYDEKEKKDHLHEVSIKFHGGMMKMLIWVWLALFAVASVLSLMKIYEADPASQTPLPGCMPFSGEFCFAFCSFGLASLVAILWFVCIYENDSNYIEKCKKKIEEADANDRNPLILIGRVRVLKGNNS